LAKILRYAGSAALAVRLLENEKENHGTKSGFALELGKAQLASGATDKAIASLKKAVKNSPKNWEPHSALGIAHDTKGAYGAAKTEYNKALSLSRDNPSVLNNMAIFTALSGDIETAIKTLKRVASVARHNPQTRQNLALFYGIRGDTDEAEALAKMDLGTESIRNNLAVFLKFRSKKGLNNLN
jgi:Flp pilus assembly protein TadD